MASCCKREHGSRSLFLRKGIRVKIHYRTISSNYCVEFMHIGTTKATFLPCLSLRKDLSIGASNFCQAIKAAAAISFYASLISGLRSFRSETPAHAYVLVKSSIAHAIGKAKVWLCT